MTGNIGFSDLSEGDRARLNAAVEKFAEICQSPDASASDIPLDYFLPNASDPLRRTFLLNLIPLDLERSWIHGNRLKLESYVSRFSELAADNNVPVALLVAEYDVRRRFEEPDLQEYAARFPHLYAEFRETVTGPSAPIDPPAAEPTDVGNRGSEGGDSGKLDQTLASRVDQTIRVEPSARDAAPRPPAESAGPGPTSHVPPVGRDVHDAPTRNVFDDPPPAEPPNVGDISADETTGVDQTMDPYASLRPDALNDLAEDDAPNETPPVFPAASDPAMEGTPPDPIRGDSDRDEKRTLTPSSDQTIRASDSTSMRDTPAINPSDSSLPTKPTMPVEAPQPPSDPAATMAGGPGVTPPAPPSTGSGPLGADQLFDETNRRAEDEISGAPTGSGSGPAAGDSAAGGNMPHTGAELVSPGTPSHSGPQANKTLGGGRYQLLFRLGKGQYGEVWSATAQGGIPVAIKVIQFPIGHQMSQQELRSLQVMRDLRHPLLVQVHAYWVENDQLIIVMSLADKTLEGRKKECIKEGLTGIPLKEIVEYVRDIAQALDFLHSKQVVHRDIKPANMLIEGGKAKVGDFGLARVLERHGDASMVKQTVIGTPMYMGPEVFNGKSDHSTDQYSLAVSYVELRLDRPPFSGRSLAEVMNKHLNSPPELDGLEERERKVVERALAKNPKDRFATCEEFARELEKATLPPDYTVRRLIQGMAAVLTLTLIGWGVWMTFFRFGIVAEDTLAVPAAEWRRTTVQLSQPLVKRNYTINVVGVTPQPDRSEADRTLTATLHPIESLPEPSDSDEAETSTQVAMKPTWEVRFSERDTGHDYGSLEIRLDSTAPSGSGFVVTVPDVNQLSLTCDLEIEALSGRLSDNDTIRLRIVEAQVASMEEFFPCRGDGSWRKPEVRAPLYKIGDRNFFRTAILDLDRFAIEFRLVPGPRPFYIMETMVWNELFAHFSDDSVGGDTFQPDSIWRRRHKSIVNTDEAAEYGRLPALYLTIIEARDFAKWMGGRLPTVEEWERAGGRDVPMNEIQDYGSADDYCPDGPYSNQWTSSGGGIAIGDRTSPPWPVGSAPLDVSWCGVRDMAGNGQEWLGEFHASHLGDHNLIMTVDQLPDFREESTNVITIAIRGQSIGEASPYQWDSTNLFSGERATSFVERSSVNDVDNPADFVGNVYDQPTLRHTLSYGERGCRVVVPMIAPGDSEESEIDSAE